MPLSDMNFKEMADFVLGERFDEAKRNEVKEVLNAVYGLAFHSNQWDFRHTTAAVTVNAGSDEVQALPTDLGPIEVLVTEHGQRLEYSTPRQFLHYEKPITQNSQPAIYTRLGDAVKIAPSPTESSTDWEVAYERRLTFMVQDTDVPNWPAEFRYGVLVQGARAQMLAGENDPTYDMPQSYSEQALTGCVRDYISDRRFTLLQYGRDSIGSGFG